MGKAQELPVHITETKEADTPGNANVNHQQAGHWLRQYKWWLQIAIYTIFILSGQSVATLLGRLYFDQGGKSKWMATLVQTAGFPLLIPFLFISPTKNQIPENSHTIKPSFLILASFWVLVGVFGAGCSMLYSIGLLYLPVSTFSLICASRLAFNAFFSFFLNSQKFTPFIVNSLVLLTISSALLVFQDDSGESNRTSKGKHVIGFSCTVAASAGYALMFSITQLAYEKILKSQSLRVIVKVIVYQSLVATCAILVGLFASGEWKSLKTEMGEFKMGKVSYVMDLVWSAVSWQVFSIGTLGLIFKVSSLFSNVISTLGLPIVPVLAVVIFNEKMTGVKVVSMLLAIWGFVSYIYQHYIDDLKSKEDSENVSQVYEVSLVERD